MQGITVHMMFVNEYGFLIACFDSVCGCWHSPVKWGLRHAAEAVLCKWCCFILIMESLFRRGEKKGMQKSGCHAYLDETTGWKSCSDCLRETLWFIGKTKKGRGELRKSKIKRKDCSWRRASETYCDCSYNARLTRLEMHGSEGTELCCSSSHSAQCRWSCFVCIISVKTSRNGKHFKAVLWFF